MDGRTEDKKEQPYEVKIQKVDVMEKIPLT
jgi:hypothetical protein